MVNNEEKFKELIQEIADTLKPEWWDKILLVSTSSENEDENYISIIAWLNGTMHSYEDAKIDKEIIDKTIEKVRNTIKESRKTDNWECLSVSIEKDKGIKVSFDFE